MIHPEDYYKLIYKIAHGMARKAKSEHHVLDMAQEGMLAAVEAVKTFDVSKGYEFSTYMKGPVIWAIKRYLCRNLYAVALPLTPAVQTAVASGLWGRVCFSLDVPLGDHEDSMDWIDTLEDRAESQHAQLEDEELRQFVERVLELKARWSSVQYDILHNRLLDVDKPCAL